MGFWGFGVLWFSNRIFKTINILYEKIEMLSKSHKQSVKNLAKTAKKLELSEELRLQDEEQAYNMEYSEDGSPV